MTVHFPCLLVFRLFPYHLGLLTVLAKMSHFALAWAPEEVIPTLESTPGGIILSPLYLFRQLWEG